MGLLSVSLHTNSHIRETAAIVERSRPQTDWLFPLCTRHQSQSENCL